MSIPLISVLIPPVPEGMDLETQRELFKLLLNEIELDGDLVNKVVEAALETLNADEVLIDRYPLPAEDVENARCSGTRRASRPRIA
jgi:hypothetical protein